MPDLSTVPAAAKGNQRQQTIPITWLLIAGALMASHAAFIAHFGTRGQEPFVSSMVLQFEAAASVVAGITASRRSGPLGRYFWLLMTLSWTTQIIGETCLLFLNAGLWSDVLFQFSTLPIGMTLFLEPDHELDYALRLFHAARHEADSLRAALEPQHAD